MSDDFATKAARIIVRGWHGVSVMFQADDGGEDRTINAIADVIRCEHGIEEWHRKVKSPHSAVARRAANELLECGRLHDYARDDGVGDVAAIIDDALWSVLQPPPPAVAAQGEGE